MYFKYDTFQIRFYYNSVYVNNIVIKIEFGKILGRARARCDLRPLHPPTPPPPPLYVHPRPHSTPGPHPQPQIHPTPTPKYTPTPLNPLAHSLTHSLTRSLTHSLKITHKRRSRK